MRWLVDLLNRDGPWLSRAAWVFVSIAMLILISAVIGLHAAAKIGERFASDVVYYAMYLIGIQFTVYSARKGFAEWGGHKRKAKTEDAK